jgi:hypothetical protein
MINLGFMHDSDQSLENLWPSLGLHENLAGVVVVRGVNCLGDVLGGKVVTIQLSQSRMLVP